jgi:hypothetical protein
MPKIPMYTLAWSPARETYELYQTRDRGVLSIVPESRAWFAWLDGVSSFAFVGKGGRFTARKEAKQCGDRYWYAYLQRVNSSPKSIWAGALTSPWHGWSTSRGCSVLKALPTYLLPSLWQEQVRMVRWMPSNVPCLPSGTSRSIRCWRPSSIRLALAGSRGQRPYALSRLPDCRPANP